MSSRTTCLLLSVALSFTAISGLPFYPRENPSKPGIDYEALASSKSSNSAETAESIVLPVAVDQPQYGAPQPAQYAPAKPQYKPAKLEYKPAPQPEYKPAQPQYKPAQPEYQPAESRYNEPEYVAKPYNYAYEVQDPAVDLNFGQKEESDGSVVTGEYRVLLPDGRTQIVRYRADWKTGYTAEVIYEGEAKPYQPPVQPYKAQPEASLPAYG